MPETIDAQVVPESQALAVRQSGGAVGPALGVNELLAQVKLIQDVMHKVMSEGEHYGTIPGCGDKKTLLQPGAQKLTMTFRLAPEYELQEVNLDRGHKEYRVICTLKSIGSGSFVGQGVGCCSTMESKYRWRGGARKCPECGKEAIIKGKAEFGGGWLCWAKKGGCGTKWNDGAAEIEEQSIDKVENDNPADCYNTVLKMAKKRAFVDATITATAASDIFTQDVGDDENAPSGDSESPGRAETAPRSQAKPTPSAAPPRPKETAKPPAGVATVEMRAKMIAKLNANPGSPNRNIVTDFFRKCENCLLPIEQLEDLPLKWVPRWGAQFRDLVTAIRAFGNGEPAKLPYPAGPEAPVPAETKPVEVPREGDPDSPNAPWRAFPVPFGTKAGTKLADLPKNYLFGLWANFEVKETWTNEAGTEIKTKPEKLAKDRIFRQMLDDAGRHYQFKTPEDGGHHEEQRREAENEGQPEEDDDNLPF